VVKGVRICDIRTDGGTQPRAAIDSDLVDDYAELMNNGVEFPRPTVFHDGRDYWLADGFHRLEAIKKEVAALLAKSNIVHNTISCDVRPGTLEDAQWYSYSANKAHGQRRSNEDKRRAVEAALRHPKAARLSVRRIAEHCGVSAMTVQRRREEISASVPKLQIAERTVNRGGSTYQLNTSNIGRLPRSAESGPANVAPVGRQTTAPKVRHGEARKKLIARLTKDATKQLNLLIDICGWLQGVIDHQKTSFSEHQPDSLRSFSLR
jgi:Homeodomain-like domain